MITVCKVTTTKGDIEVMYVTTIGKVSDYHEGLYMYGN